MLPTPCQCARSAQNSKTVERPFITSRATTDSHTLRVLGRLHYVLGKPRKARKYFERAIQEAKELGAKYDQARSMIDMATVFDDCKHQQQAGFQLLRELSAVMPEAERLQLLGMTDRQK